MSQQFDSLTSPRDKPAIPVRRVLASPLTEDEMGEAREAKIKSLKFAQVDRQYADPPIHNQNIVLVSFVPAKGARPDEDNIYGMMKVRGVFATEEEANERADNLIRNYDSYHEIFHAYVGRPFPVTNSTGFEKDIQTIDIRKKTVKLISEDILNKKRNEEKEMREIQDKEKRLLEESKRAKEDLPQDPYEVYITDQVKRAQLIWTYVETMKKCKQMKTLVQHATEAIEKSEAENPTFKDQYKQKYFDARKEAGLQDSATEESFLKYLGLDQLPNLNDEEDI